MATATKADLQEQLHKSQREAASLKAELNSLRASLDFRFVNCGRTKCIALPLTDEESRAVADFAEIKASEWCGEGDRIATESETRWQNDMAIEWRYSSDITLPRFVGVLIRYSYDEADGTSVDGVWGLVEVK